MKIKYFVDTSPPFATGRYKIITKVSSEVIGGKIPLVSRDAKNTAEYTQFIIDIGHAIGEYTWEENTFYFLMEKLREYPDANMGPLMLLYAKVKFGREIPDSLYDERLVELFQKVLEVWPRVNMDFKQENIGIDSQDRPVLFDTFFGV